MAKGHRKPIGEFMEDARLSDRVRQIVLSEGLVMSRLAEVIGIPHKNLSAWIRGHHLFGKERTDRVRVWLTNWDSGDVDIEALKIDQRWANKPEKGTL